jgi:chromosome segregation ATPase
MSAQSQSAAEIKRFQGIIAMLQSDKNSLSLELKLATNSRDELQKKLNERESKLSEKLIAKEADVEALKKSNNEQGTMIESLRKRVLSLNEKLSAAENESDSLHVDIESLRQKALEFEDAAKNSAFLAKKQPTN